MLSETRWQAVRPSAFDDLKQPPKQEIKAVLNQQFHHARKQAQQRFPGDGFANIKDGKLQLKRYDKIALPPAVTTLQ